MPNWILLLICVLAALFIILGIYICIQMRRNKSERSLQERAIIRELSLAKEEGVEIPEDLEKRLERFQNMDEKANAKKGMTRNMKVHPEDAVQANMASPEPKSRQRNLTRYDGGMNQSENRLINKNAAVDYDNGNFNGPLASPFRMEDTLNPRSGISVIQQPLESEEEKYYSHTGRKSNVNLTEADGGLDFKRKLTLNDIAVESCGQIEENDINDLTSVPYRDGRPNLNDM